MKEVIGLRIKGKIKEGVKEKEIVINVKKMMRKKGVVGKLVELLGEGIEKMQIEESEKIGNMGKEYGEK